MDTASKEYILSIFTVFLPWDVPKMYDKDFLGTDMKNDKKFSNFNINTTFAGTEIPIMMMKQPWHRFNFMMRIPKVRQHHYTETTELANKKIFQFPM